MADYDNNLRGVAFYNDYKKTDNQPSYRGSLEIDGVKYKQSIWVKVGKNGKKFLSFSYEVDQQDTDERPQYKKTTTATPTLKQVEEELDDEIPFK
jgi:hypothetical protein